MLIKVHASQALADAQTVAGCLLSPEEDSFDLYRNAIWKSLRESYPTTFTVDALTSLQIKEEECTHEYVTRALEMWERGTGERADASALSLLHSEEELWKDCQPMSKTS